MKNKIILVSILLLTFTFISSAHQPRLTYGDTLTFEKPAVINNPDISQAFYGELKKGEPDHYAVTLSKDFPFYISVLTPDNANAAKEVSVMMISTNPPLSSIPLELDGKNFPWTKYYEEFAGDNYFKGPETEKTLRAGEYMIVVSAKDNVGKYVLVVGKTESFPFVESIKTILALPSLKMTFFETSFFTIFSGIIGKGLLILIAIIAILIFGIYKITRRILRKRKKI
jgi:hypothetical protein